MKRYYETNNTNCLSYIQTSAYLGQICGQLNLPRKSLEVTEVNNLLKMTNIFESATSVSRQSHNCGGSYRGWQGWSKIVAKPAASTHTGDTRHHGEMHTLAELHKLWCSRHGSKLKDRPKSRNIRHIPLKQHTVCTRVLWSVWRKWHE